MLESLLEALGPRQAASLPDAASALPGRPERMAVPPRHHVNGHSMQAPYPEGLEAASFAMGCFWGAERKFWQQQGVTVTAVGYAGGFTPNPSYEEVCSGLTGHAEAVWVVFDPRLVSYGELLVLFWESHDPTQGMRQGNDIGTQYRSIIFTHSQMQKQQALASRQGYQHRLNQSGFEAITTEIEDAGEFYFAESHHQQYLAKNPGGYCGLGGTGVSCSD
ncbi:MAG: peptide-methionine (S)-S-oxide reductase MsrA [Methylococcaceae bacterium]|nr:peptide-methionine (S)-S-oxide reductase MsrA [Methylococcaceae bacterium]